MTDVSSGLRNEIKPINPEVSHRICSGQVIVTLATAVKELVENSLDAGAKSVEIRLVDSGSKLIQVVDNGSGVAETNFAGLARKHCTSKLKEFEDLNSIGTFGFRGEALSSLCALSNMTVTTRTKDYKQGFEIDYNQQGEIVKQATVARQQGTTVSIRNIFSPLPVRHKEFLKHLKREFNRMVTVLYGYSIVAKGVRISCTHECNGSTSNVLCVPASVSTKERIGSIFGTNQVASLSELEVDVNIEDSVAAEFGLTGADLDRGCFDLSGWISSPNAGRSSADRQFYFINSRPWDSPKVARLVNEVYSGFSRSQFPFVVLNITANQENVDVNVTPDKRSIFVQNEKLLYAKIKATILKTLTKTSSQFCSSEQSSLAFPILQTQPKRSCSKNSDTPVQSQEVEVVAVENNSQEYNFYESDTNSTSSTQSPKSTCRFDPQRSSIPANSKSPKESTTVRSFLSKFKYGTSSTPNDSKSNIALKRPYTSTNNSSTKTFKKSAIKQPKLMDFIHSKQRQNQFSNEAQTDDEDEVEILENNADDDLEKVESNENCDLADTEGPMQNGSEEDLDEGYPEESIGDDEKENNSGTAADDSEGMLEEYSEDYCDVHDLVEAESEPLLFMNIFVNWNSVLSNVSKVKTVIDSYSVQEEERNARKFRAKISPDQNSTAEQELKQSLSKEMFKQMKLIGQFNLGFIVAKLNSDLFIFDQHAADEKFNYEDLEKRTVLNGQRLIIPMPLHLTSVGENILMENLAVFEKNGFSFNIKPNGEPTQRISLTKIPYSKSCQFGKEDVEELIFLLQDAPEKSFYRPVKVKTMLASRACRKSVMVGDRLNLNDMRRVVGQLGTIEHPWNCPHGRPTLRHLFNLNLLPDPDWFGPT